MHKFVHGAQIYRFVHTKPHLFNVLNLIGLVQGSFYGAVRKLTFLEKLILILMFDSFLNC